MATPSHAALLLARCWYAAVAAVIAASIAIQVILLCIGGADANSGETGDAAGVGVRLVRLFMFFTIDSNIVVLVVCLLLLARPLRGGFWWEALRLNALVAITVTGVVYAALLAPPIQLEGWALATMVGLHVVSPIGFVAAWLCFGPRPRVRWATVPAAFVLPLAWIGMTFVRGAAVDWYPYPFLDVGSLGLGRALANAALILLAAVVLALVFRLLDAKLPSVLRGLEPGPIVRRAKEEHAGGGQQAEADRRY